MNDVQLFSFDLLKNFITVCDKLNLNWFMINGSALGAVKYQGFIPWDDDIDVGMPRSDYELFLEKAQEMLPSHIFVQNYRTDKNFPFIYSKLRNSNTTFIEAGVKHLDINHGIYIDIFPLDGYPEDENERKKLQKKKKLFIWKSMCVINDKRKLKVMIRNSIFKMLGFGSKTQKILRCYDLLISNYKDGLYICNHGDRMKGKQLLSREIYGQGTEANFEGIKVKVPEKIEDYLTHKYGEWRSDPPDNEQTTHHITTTFDVNTPYTKFFS